MAEKATIRLEGIQALVGEGNDARIVELAKELDVDCANTFVGRALLHSIIVLQERVDRLEAERRSSPVDLAAEVADLKDQVRQLRQSRDGRMSACSRARTNRARLDAFERRLKSLESRVQS